MKDVRVTHGEHHPHDDRPGSLLDTPYNEDFVTDLKDSIPYPHRAWVPDEKLWWVAAEFADEAVKLAAHYFGEVRVTDEDGNEDWVGRGGVVARQERLL